MEVTEVIKCVNSKYNARFGVEQPETAVRMAMAHTSLFSSSVGDMFANEVFELLVKWTLEKYGQ